jgi:hypothetical protein
MNKMLPALTTALIGFITTSLQAELILYEPFDYPAGDRLGGAGTNGVGKIAPNGQTWITRSWTTNTMGYVETNDTLITAGSLSYPGLATSRGNSVRYGSPTNLTVATKLYTDAIALPSIVTEGSLYYSAIVRFNSGMPSGATRGCYAAFSAESADPTNDVQKGLITASGNSNIQLPAGAWLRYSGSTDFHFGSGKQNGDGLGTSAGSPSWQAAGAPYYNQAGNTTGAGQSWATISNNTYFIVMKYTFNNNSAADDTVSMWINPIASTLGYADGEWAAGTNGGSYYSATNAFTTANIDAPQIQSFILLGLSQSDSTLNRTIDTSFDELRIGTTWAEVTPLPPPPPPQIISIAGAGTTSVTVTWTNAQVGTNYVLQYNTNLLTTNWANLAPVTASATTASQTDNPPGAAAARFYRVLKP